MSNDFYLPSHFLTKGPERILMNPARQTMSTENSSRTWSTALSNSTRLLYNLWLITCNKKREIHEWWRCTHWRVGWGMGRMEKSKPSTHPKREVPRLHNHMPGLVKAEFAFKCNLQGWLCGSVYTLGSRWNSQHWTSKSPNSQAQPAVTHSGGNASFFCFV